MTIERGEGRGGVFRDRGASEHGRGGTKSRAQANLHYPHLVHFVKQKYKCRRSKGLEEEASERQPHLFKNQMRKGRAPQRYCGSMVDAVVKGLPPASAPFFRASVVCATKSTGLKEPTPSSNQPPHIADRNGRQVRILRAQNLTNNVDVGFNGMKNGVEGEGNGS